MKIFNETKVKQEIKLLQIAVISSSILGICAIAAFFMWGNFNSDSAFAASETISAGSTVYASDDPFTGVTSGDTLTINGKFVMDVDHSIMSDDSVIIIVDGTNSEIKLMPGTNLYLGTGSSVILVNSGKFKIQGYCDSTTALYIGGVRVATCDGTGGTSFGDLNDNGGVGPLPVAWVDFTATHMGNSEVLLKWSTATEINNEFFQVEYSSDAVNWISGPIVHSKAPGGNSNELLEYQINHYAAPSETTLYYRVMQVDYDRKFDYSDVRAVNFDRGDHMTISTMGESKIRLEYSGDRTHDATLNVYNTAGALVISKDYVDGEVISLPAAGIYIVELMNGSRVERIKQVVQ